MLHSGYGTAFDCADLWSFGNGFDRNVAIFGVDNSLSNHSENLKNDFLMLSEGPTIDIDDSVNITENI